MSNKKLLILGIVAVFMMMWAVIQPLISSRYETGSDGLSYLIQGLDPADIDSIVLGTGDNAVTLKRQRNGFVVVNKDNYPAKTSQINDLISKCLEIQRSQFVTDKAANHEDLEVTEDKAGTVIKFMKADPNSPLLTGIIIGKTKELGQGSYVRLASDDRVYVTPNVPWFGSGAMNFIESQIVSIKREEIESVTVSYPGGKYVLKPKENSKDIILENIPTGKKINNNEVQSVFTALSSLSFSDVKRNTGDLSFDRQYVCRLKDSTEYTLNIAAQDGKTYINCIAVFTEGRPTTIKKDESEEELKIKEAKMLVDDKAKKFAAMHQAWIYEIADYKAKLLTKELEDLVEDAPEEQAVDPNEM
ncbi:MAG: DUF4340 domain-containing protein [Sedimentisphaerales bacterium]|nr:DUF4340 domain-containing protein [Sedimentisphaerales bacterium]